MLGQC